MDEGAQQAALQPHLLPGESILWTGRPDPRRLLSSADWYIVPFTLMWGGFAIVWEAGVIFYGAPPLFVLWGIPFVLVGQYMIWGRFLYKRWDRSRTGYAVTNQRLLALRGSHLRSMRLSLVPSINQSTRPDGGGSLDFAASHYPTGYWANAGMPGFDRSRAGLAFYDIPDVAGVHRLIAEMQSGKG